MPSTNSDFKTRLTFNPGKLSTGILKRYLSDMLNTIKIEELFSKDIPLEYNKDPDYRTNYMVLKDLGEMSVREWKAVIENNGGNVELLYLNDDMMVQDSKEYYNSWKIIQEEVGNHERPMSFFRLVSEIVEDLSSRNVVELSYEGDNIVSSHHEWENVVRGPVKTLLPKDMIQMNPIEDLTGTKSADNEPSTATGEEFTENKQADQVFDTLSVNSIVFDQNVTSDEPDFGNCLGELF